MSCLYDSLSSFFTNINSYELRQLICNELSKNPILYDEIDVNTVVKWTYNKSLEEYVNIMKNQNTWGSSIEIKMFCEIFSCYVFIHHNERIIEFKCLKNPNYIIHLNYTGNHYTNLSIQQL